MRAHVFPMHAVLSRSQDALREQKAPYTPKTRLDKVMADLGASRSDTEERTHLINVLSPVALLATCVVRAHFCEKNPTQMLRCNFDKFENIIPRDIA